MTEIADAVHSGRLNDVKNETSTEVELELRVEQISTPADGVRVLDLIRPDGADLPAWSAGAHIDLHLGELVRQYSMCGDPGDRKHWQVAVLLETESRGGSRFVHDRLSAGDSIVVRGPRNHFRLEPAARYRFIAGGIGVTPLLPMMAEAEAAGAEWTLDYGGRDRASMAFVAELTQRYGEKVRVHPRDESRLSTKLAEILADPMPGELVYCCGPAPLLAAVEQGSTHWPEGSLHVEHFTPREVLVEADDVSFDVELAQSGLLLRIPADKPIMTVMREANVDVPSSCEEGTCGTCETGVLSGEVDHRDSLLTPAEQAANDVMFICVSRAARGCSRLVLDR
jgi:ferredoxin-NADP reductase